MALQRPSHCRRARESGICLQRLLGGERAVPQVDDCRSALPQEGKTYAASCTRKQPAVFASPLWGPGCCFESPLSRGIQAEGAAVFVAAGQDPGASRQAGGRHRAGEAPAAARRPGRCPRTHVPLTNTACWRTITLPGPHKIDGRKQTLRSQACTCMRHAHKRQALQRPDH